MRASRRIALALLTSACGTACSSSSGDGGAADDAAIDADGTAADTDLPGVDGARTDTASGVDGARDTGAGSDTAATSDSRPGVDGGADVAPPDGGPSCTFTKDADGFFKLTSPKSDYWVRLPPGYESAPTPRALLFGMHGCGDTALNFATWAIVPYALRTTQTYVAVSLGGREGACWTISSDVAVAQAALAHVQTCFNVDAKKIVLAGYSSGGGMAYTMGLKTAASFAGILIENSGLSQAVGAGSVDTVLASAAWKINIAQSARISDASYPIAGIRADRDKIIAAGFPLQYRELDGTHDGTTDDWALFLIPKMAGWTAP